MMRFLRLFQDGDSTDSEWSDGEPATGPPVNGSGPLNSASALRPSTSDSEEEFFKPVSLQKNNVSAFGYFFLQETAKTIIVFPSMDL